MSHIDLGWCGDMTHEEPPRCRWIPRGILVQSLSDHLAGSRFKRFCLFSVTQSSTICVPAFPFTEQEKCNCKSETSVSSNYELWDAMAEGAMEKVEFLLAAGVDPNARYYELGSELSDPPNDSLPSAMKNCPSHLLLGQHWGFPTTDCRGEPSRLHGHIYTRREKGDDGVSDEGFA